MGTKFYKTVFVVTVLSDTSEVANLTLGGIAEEITSGDSMGTFKVASSEEISSKKAANLAEDLGGAPEFFGINADGKSIS